MLQLKTYKAKSEKKPYIRVDTRELNGVPSIKVSNLYMLDYWSMLY